MDLLNPHILTQNDLMKILLERHLNINDLDKKSFNDLLELYYNFVMPLHQRNLHRKDDGPNSTNRNVTIKLNNGSSNHRLKNNSSSVINESSNENACIYKRIEVSNDAASIDSSGGVSKKLKVMNGARNDVVLPKTPSKVMLKRPAESIIGTLPKHKKITWP